MSARTLALTRRQVNNEPHTAARKKKTLLYYIMRPKEVCSSPFKIITLEGTQELFTHQQQEHKVAFTRKYLQWDMTEWHYVPWSDEALFRVSCSQGLSVHTVFPPFVPQLTLWSPCQSPLLHSLLITPPRPPQLQLILQFAHNFCIKQYLKW